MSLTIGDKASRSTLISDAMIRAFAEASGDTNPVHLDDSFATQTQFGKRIAHGMLTASLISAVLGNDLPGRGTIYLSQSLAFKAPVLMGDEITATVEVTNFRERSRVATFRTTCINQNGTLVLEGEAVVLAPKTDE